MKQSPFVFLNPVTYNPLILSYSDQGIMLGYMKHIISRQNVIFCIICYFIQSLYEVKLNVITSVKQRINFCKN